MAAILAASSAVVAAAPASIVKSSRLSSNAAQMTFSPLRLAHARVVSSATRRTSVSAKLQTSPSLFDGENVQDNVAKTMAGSLFFLLSTVGNAAAAEEVFQLADSDSRGFLLLAIMGPAVGWVLFNILKPALNQFDRMKSVKGLIGAIGLGSAASLLAAPSADAAQEVAQLAVDARPLVLLVVLAPALGWVLFNILKPALNQLNKMRGAKSFVGALGLGAAGSMLTADQANAAQEVAQLAADNRPLILLVVVGPAIGWVLFNILQPALRQLQNMITDGSTPPKKRK